MPRLSRTHIASAHSYNMNHLSPRLEIVSPQNGGPAGMSYYQPSHQTRVASLSTSGGGGYYDQMPEASLPSPVSGGGGTFSHDSFAVGGPATAYLPPVITVSANSGSSNGMRGSGCHPSDATATPTGTGAAGSRTGGRHYGSFSVQHPRSSSGAWTPQDDEQLVRARKRGENWAQIQTRFAGKTANACRKRHERLVERRNADDVDARRVEIMAREYMALRRELWQPLAQRTGERWTTVESRCMGAGLKNLQGMSRAAARRDRLEASYGLVEGDIPGTAATASIAIDTLGHLSPLPDDHDASGSSPGGSSSSSSSHGPYNSHPGAIVTTGYRSVSGHSSRSSHSSHSSAGAVHIMPPPTQQQQPTQQRRYQQQQYTAQHAQQVTAGSVSPTGGGYADLYATTAEFSHSLRGMEVPGPQQAGLEGLMPRGPRGL